ncbi:MAG: ABC transporter ATP-binding protein [Patescibacteria group bacterium]
MILVKNLKKIYPTEIPIMALKGVSFGVKTGEFVAIMGRSGSGKSTVLHQLGLLDRPTAGEILIDGVDVVALSGKERRMFRLKQLGYVFQEYALLYEFTALENVYFPAFAAGEKYKVFKSRAEELLKLVNLPDRMHHYPKELSGGEQQRVAIARALVNQPKILFADEPCAHLDSASSKIILELFLKLNKELGQTIVLVTHEEEDRKYVSRVILLKDGLIDKNE